MVKRIWKKPGTGAWKRAMRKSASRMARDFIRVPDEKRQESWRNYLKNKNPTEYEKLRGLITEVQPRRIKEIEEIRKRHEDYQKKEERIRRTVDALIEKARKGDIDGAKKARDYSRALLSEQVDFAQELQELEKKLPINEARELRIVRQRYEHECLKLIRNIRDLENWIAEEE